MCLGVVAPGYTEVNNKQLTTEPSYILCSTLPGDNGHCSSFLDQAEALDGAVGRLESTTAARLVFILLASFDACGSAYGADNSVLLHLLLALLLALLFRCRFARRSRFCSAFARLAFARVSHSFFGLKAAAFLYFRRVTKYINKYIDKYINT